MKTFLVFLLCAGGLYLLSTAFWPGVYAPAAAALRARAPKKLTQFEIATQSLAGRLLPYLEIDPIRKAALEEELRSLGHVDTPEMFRAKTIARAALFSAPALVITPLSTILGIGACAGIFILMYTGSEKKLRREMDARRERIERELPQLASTIRQSLNASHDVIAILESYRKVCGPTLRDEIGRTLNDMKTGNPERALKAFESRVSSAKLSELTRGLVGVLRGDDRRVYFDMLTVQYQKSANEAVSKALQLRPQKLYPYLGLLFLCLILMTGVAIGMYIAKQWGGLF